MNLVGLMFHILECLGALCAMKDRDDVDVLRMPVLVRIPRDASSIRSEYLLPILVAVQFSRGSPRRCRMEGPSGLRLLSGRA